MKLVVVAVVAFLVAWPVFDGAYRHGGDRPLTTRPVVGALGGDRVERPAVRVLRDEEAFLSFTGRRRTSVDFERETVVFVSPGPRSSTAYGIALHSVTEERARVVVRVRELTPRAGRAGQPRVTFPYRLFAIPATDKAVTVAWVGR